MEQLIFFVLGIITVLLIMGVVVMLRTQKKSGELRDKLRDSNIAFEREFESIHRDVNELDKTFNSRLEREIEVMNRNFDEIYRTIDSRTDKLAAKFENNFRDIQDVVAEINNKLK